MARLWNRNGVSKAVFMAGASFAACLAAASPAYGQTEAEQAAQAATKRPRKEDETIVVTATKRETTLLEVPFSINAQTEEDIQRLGAGTIEDLSRNVAGLNVQNLGPGPEPDLDPRSLRRPDHPRPAGREGAGRRLSRRIGDLAVAVPARPRPVRPEPRRDPARAAGHPVRLRLGRRHHPLHHQPARRLDRSKAVVEANLNIVDEDGFGGHLKGAINVPLGDTAAIRAVGYHTEYAGFIDARRHGDGLDEDVNDGRRTGGRHRLAVPADARHLDHPAHRLPGGPRQRLQPAGGVQPLRQSLHDHPPAGDLRASASNSCCLDEDFKDDTLLADLTASAGPRRSRAHLGDDLHQPRHPRQPRRQRADRKRLGRPRLPDRRRAAAVQPRRHDRPQDLDPGIADLLERRRAVPVADRRLLFGRGPGLRPAPARPRATTPSPTPASAPAPRRRSPTASRSTRPTMPTCPTTSSRRRCSARRATTSARR